MVAALAWTASSQGTEAGTSFCFGLSCPCGNDDAAGGCKNSTGHGARLVATGSTSVAADTIVYSGSFMPPNKVSLLVFAQSQRNVPFGDGRLCVGPGMQRMRSHMNTNQFGTVDATGVIAKFAEHGLFVHAGETWHAQMWYRDPAPNFACDNHPPVDYMNMTNAYTVTFTP
jgi:hypothetical protein